MNLGSGELREQPLPRFALDVEGFQHPPERVHHLVARGQACDSRLPGALRRALAAHREEPGTQAARARVEALPRLPHLRAAGAMARRALQGFRRRELRGVPRAGRAVDRIARGTRRDARRQRGARVVSARPAGGAGEALPFVPLRQPRQVRDAPHDGRGTSAHELRAGHLRRHRARALRDRRRLEGAQGRVGRRARLGGGPGARGRGAARRAARSAPQPRWPLPRARRVRLPRVPPPDVGYTLDAAPRIESRPHSPQQLQPAHAAADRAPRGCPRARRAISRSGLRTCIAPWRATAAIPVEAARRCAPCWTA